MEAIPIEQHVVEILEFFRESPYEVSSKGSWLIVSIRPPETICSIENEALQTTAAGAGKKLMPQEKAGTRKKFQRAAGIEKNMEPLSAGEARENMKPLPAGEARENMKPLPAGFTGAIEGTEPHPAVGKIINILPVAEIGEITYTGERIIEQGESRRYLTPPSRQQKDIEDRRRRDLTGCCGVKPVG